MTNELEGLPLDSSRAVLERRRRELQPFLAKLSEQALEAFDLLRPLAQHVSEVELDAPLRHQQVLAEGGGQIADYLMVGFGGDHSMRLYHNFVRRTGWNYDWEFSRSIPVAAKKTEETKVTALFEPDLYNLEVVSYTYPQEIGRDGGIDDYLCSQFDNFHSAETYLREFETDIERAVREFDE